MLFWPRKSASPSGSDRLAHPGRDIKSSPWPPSVSRSTDRVTQDNGIDPKPFWRLRALPEEPHLIKPRPGCPHGAPRRRPIFSAHRQKNGDCATNSLAVILSKQRTQPEANWLAGRCERIRDCHKRRPKKSRRINRSLPPWAGCPSTFSHLPLPDPPLPMAYLDQKPGLPRQQLPQILAWAVPYLTRTKPLNPQTREWQCHP